MDSKAEEIGHHDLVRCFPTLHLSGLVIQSLATWDVIANILSHQAVYGKEPLVAYYFNPLPIGLCAMHAIA